MFSTHPPFETKRTDGFVEPSNNFTYHEERHGGCKPDESDEGAADRCESESDDHEASAESLPKESPKRFVTPQNKRVLPGSDRCGEVKVLGKQRFASTSKASIQNRGAADSPSKTNRNHSANAGRKPTPRRFGMFSAAAAQMQEYNSAGEAMDAMLGPGDLIFNDELEPGRGGASGGGANNNTPLPPNPERLSNDLDSTDFQSREGISQAASDGDVEDNASELDEARKELKPVQIQVRDLRSTTAKAPRSLRKSVVKRVAATSSAADAPRRSARHAKVEVGGRKAATRTEADKAKRTAVSNRSKMTARAMSLRKKAEETRKEERADAKAASFEAVYGRRSRGKKPQKHSPPRDGVGNVTVVDDEQDDSQAQGQESKSWKRQGDTTADAREEDSRAVYGRKRKPKTHDEIPAGCAGEVPAAVARQMEEAGGVVEVDDEVDVEEYEAME